MTPTGGLKLALIGSGHDDRRLRFAGLTIVADRRDDELALVTDSRGRMRRRLPAGEYHLQLEAGGENSFAERDGRWTAVRVRL